MGTTSTFLITIGTTHLVLPILTIPHFYSLFHTSTYTHCPPSSQHNLLLTNHTHSPRPTTLTHVESDLDYLHGGVCHSGGGHGTAGHALGKKTTSRSHTSGQEAGTADIALFKVVKITRVQSTKH